MTLLFELDEEAYAPREVKPFEGYREFTVHPQKKQEEADVDTKEGQEPLEAPSDTDFEPREPDEEQKEQEEEETQREKRRILETCEAECQERLRQAEEILNTAREEADKMREEALSEGRQAGYEEGLKSGYDEGYADGEQKALESHREACEQELEALRSQVADTIRDMGHLKEKMLEKYLDNLKDISLAVAEKIVQTSLKSSSEIIKRMIVVSTEKLKKVAWAKIYIGRGDDSGLSVRGDSELIHELTKLSDNVKIVVMDEEPGTCIIELPSEIIDVSAGTQLENIKGILENARL